MWESWLACVGRGKLSPCVSGNLVTARRAKSGGQTGFPSHVFPYARPREKVHGVCFPLRGGGGGKQTRAQASCFVRSFVVLARWGEFLGSLRSGEGTVRCEAGGVCVCLPLSVQASFRKSVGCHEFCERTALSLVRSATHRKTLDRVSS